MRRLEHEEHPSSSKQKQQRIIPSVKAIRRIVSKFREEGTIQNKPNRGGQPAKIIESKALEVKQLLAENPDSNLKQIAEKAKIAITSLRRLAEIYPEQMKEAKARMKYLKNKKEGQKMFVRFCPSQSDFQEKMDQIKQLLVEHPTYTAAQIATIVGCNRKNKCLVDVRKKFLQEHNIKIPKIKMKKSKNISTNYNSGSAAASTSSSTNFATETHVHNNSRSIGTGSMTGHNEIRLISSSGHTHQTASNHSTGTSTNLPPLVVVVQQQQQQQQQSIHQLQQQPAAVKKRSRAAVSKKPKIGLIEWPQLDLDELMQQQQQHHQSIRTTTPTSSELDHYSSNDPFTASPTSSNHGPAMLQQHQVSPNRMYASQQHQNNQMYYQNQIQFAVNASTQQLQTVQQQQHQQGVGYNTSDLSGHRMAVASAGALNLTTNRLTHSVMSGNSQLPLLQQQQQQQHQPQQAYIALPQQTFATNVFYHKQN
jgi:transposase